MRDLLETAAAYWGELSEPHLGTNSGCAVCHIIRKGLYKQQKRQDWDHKAYDDAPSAI